MVLHAVNGTTPESSEEAEGGLLAGFLVGAAVVGAGAASLISSVFVGRSSESRTWNSSSLSSDVVLSSFLPEKMMPSAAPTPSSSSKKTIPAGWCLR